jgi:hypothetical protein
LRSARTNTFFPFRSASPRVPTLLLVAISVPAATPGGDQTRARSPTATDPRMGGGSTTAGEGDSPWIGKAGSSATTTRWVDDGGEG